VLLNDYRVQYSEKDLDFVKVRNKLIHTGLFPEDTTDVLQSCQDLSDLYNKVILTVLGWNDR
jgi:hypothetical protein